MILCVFAFSVWLGGAVARGSGNSRYCLGLMGVPMFQGGGNCSDGDVLGWLGGSRRDGVGVSRACKVDKGNGEIGTMGGMGKVHMIHGRGTREIGDSFDRFI